MFIIIFNDGLYLYSANLTSLGYRPIKVDDIRQAYSYYNKSEADFISSRFQDSRVIPNV